MPLESATYISQLVSTNPAGSDNVSVGDDHVRLLKSVLKSTFPNVNAAVTATPTVLNGAYDVPIGTVALWYDVVATIPSGWAPCDGKFYTRTDGGGSIHAPNIASIGTNPYMLKL